jgi:hypothetical protein
MFVTTKTGLKAKIDLLIKEAFVCGIGSRDAIPIEPRMIIKIANAEKRELKLNEIQFICTICKTSEKAITELIEYSPEMITKARVS